MTAASFALTNALHLDSNQVPITLADAAPILDGTPCPRDAKDLCENQGKLFKFDHVLCECSCDEFVSAFKKDQAIADAYCVATKTTGWFYDKTICACKLACAKTDASCQADLTSSTGVSPNLATVNLGTCSCVCNLPGGSQAAANNYCTTNYTADFVFDTTICACRCNKTDASCRAEYAASTGISPNFTTVDPATCTCTCNTTPDSSTSAQILIACTQQPGFEMFPYYGYYRTFNPATCGCNCG